MYDKNGNLIDPKLVMCGANGDKWELYVWGTGDLIYKAPGEATSFDSLYEALEWADAHLESDTLD